MAFADVAIPEWIQRALRKAVSAQTLPHAYLFVGPAGVGKRATALTLAKALNCRAQHGDACEQCAVCLRIDRSLHPDIHLVEPQGQAIKIDQIRHLQDLLALQAYEGRMKVAILDDAGKLTIEAANALLKILEEPPARTLFVMVCHNIGGLPATVVSRSQVLRFGVVPHDQLVALLRHHRRSQADAERAASFSGGKPGKALALALPMALEMRAHALRLLTQAHASDAAVLLASAEQWARRKSDHDFLFEVLLSLARDLAVICAGGDDAMLMHADLKSALSPLAISIPLATVWEVFDIIHMTQQAMAHNANPQLAFEVMLFNIGDAYERARRRGRPRHQYSCRA
jgi:DNA polymerase III subunit delta'